MLSAATAMYFLRRKRISANSLAPKVHRWQDSQFKSQNLMLYATEAEQRLKQISDVKYSMLLKLSDQEEKGYEGNFRTVFKLNEAPSADKPLFLDFHGQEISHVKINTKVVQPEQVRFENHRIYLPESLLEADERNEVQFQFRNTYVNNSAGLHYFKDPQDDKVYIFSHLEPFFCHRFFPCFDQPSVRAPLKLSVVAPFENWSVVANGVETEVKRMKVNSEEAKIAIEACNFDD